MPEKRYYLYEVAVYNPTDGTVVVEPTSVTAYTSESARNKAVALVVAAVNDAEKLPSVLDEVEITVRQASDF